MTKKIKWVPNESGRISYDIIKVIFEGDILLKTKRPGEYILAIFPIKYDEEQIMTEQKDGARRLSLVWWGDQFHRQC